jgi:hypothetical protein
MIASVRMLLPLALILASCLPAHGQVKLEWKFKENDELTLDTVALLKQTLRVGSQSGEQELEHGTKAIITVKKVHADGTVELSQLFDRVQARNRRGEGAPAGAGYVRGLEDAVLHLTLNAKREVVRLEGYDELVKRVSKDDANTAKAVRELLKPETLRRSAEELFGFLPDKPVNPGDKWERKLEAPLGPLGTVTATHAYTYAGTEAKEGKTLHKITVTTSLAYSIPKEATPGFQFKILKGDVSVVESSGEIYFDADAGRLVSSRMEMKIQGSLTVSAENQMHELTLEQDNLLATMIKQ